MASAWPEPPNAKCAGARCGVQATFAVSGTETPPNRARFGCTPTARVLRKVKKGGWHDQPSFQRLQVFDDALALSAKCGPLWVTFEGVRLLVGNSREKDVEAISHTEVDGEKCHWFAGSPAPRVASGVESSASQARKSL